MPSRTLTTNTSSTRRRYVIPAAVKPCFKDSPYLRCLFKFINYLHNEAAAIDVITYIHSIGATVVRSGRYDTSNRIVILLKNITPDDIVRWFNYLAFDTPNPTEQQKPTGCRANTLYSNKKKLSYYMIESSANWNHQAQTGNPTKDKSVNDVCKRVKKHECRGTGKESCTSEGFSRPELLTVLTGARQSIDTHI